VKRTFGVMLPCIAVFMTLGAGTQSASAQVGYPPARSPFLDVDQTQELTPFFGYFSAKKDPAKVGQTSGPLAGLQYEWRATDPLHLGVDMMAVDSWRTPQDPARPPATRTLGTISRPLYAIDGFLALSLTGARSWHHVMPMVGGGIGLVTDAHGADVGGFKFGTRFAFPWGAGVRWVPGGGHVQLRADVKDWMYTIVYPEGYYVSTTLDAPLLTSSVGRSRWTNNFAMTVGVSYVFSH
jgi:hypothetical protein